MSRQQLADLFAKCRADHRAALMPYMTAGLPTPKDSARLFVAMAEAGADAFEVGIPYADPLMDGPVIQAAGDKALAAGSGVEVGLEILAEVVSKTGKPSVVMTYVNPVLRMGIEPFADAVRDAGGSGVIIADLPVDEAEVFNDAFRARGIGLVLFVAPTTTDKTAGPGNRSRSSVCIRDRRDRRNGGESGGFEPYLDSRGQSQEPQRRPGGGRRRHRYSGPGAVCCQRGRWGDRRHCSGSPGSRSDHSRRRRSLAASCRCRSRHGGAPPARELAIAVVDILRLV